MPAPVVPTAAILLVNSDEAVFRALGARFAEAGYEIVCARSLAEAKALLAATTFDAAVVDDELSDGDGVVFATGLLDSHPNLKTILCAGDHSAQRAASALSEGLADYVRKPIDSQSLLARVSKVFQLKKLEAHNKNLLNELELLAVRDPITKLFNHVYFQEALNTEIYRSARNGLNFSVLLIGIDHFKRLNNRRGHSVGNELMKCLAMKFDPRDGARAADRWFRRQDVASHFGDDRFAILLPETNKVGATRKAAWLVKEVYGLDLSALEMEPATVSVGVTSFPEDATDSSALIELASTALKAAKRAGRNQAVAFSKNLNRETGEFRSAELARFVGLADTLRNDLVGFVYQPIVSVVDRSVFAFEALCRPKHPGFKTPLNLIDAAEKAGKMIELGRVLRKQSIAGVTHLPETASLFINLHPQELSDEQLIAIEPFLRPWAERIVFEITETAAIRDFTRLRNIMGSMRKAGFRFALDDLGAGYSGLNSLAQLEPEFVKLDRALILALERDARAARLVRHLVEFAAGEGLQVVAEGIETEAQYDSIAQLGCTLGQGYLFGRGEALPAP